MTLEHKRTIQGLRNSLARVKASNTILHHFALKYKQALETVVGCFDAAYAEGLQERLSALDNREPGELQDLIERRVLFAHGAAISALMVVPGSGPPSPWRTAGEAPENTWLITGRAGEDGINLSLRTGDEWHDSSGRSTVTHHSMAAPTHYLDMLLRPPPLEIDATHLARGAGRG